MYFHFYISFVFLLIFILVLIYRGIFLLWVSGVDASADPTQAGSKNLPRPNKPNKTMVTALICFLFLFVFCICWLKKPKNSLVIVILASHFNLFIIKHHHCNHCYWCTILVLVILSHTFCVCSTHQYPTWKSSKNILLCEQSLLRNSSRICWITLLS